MDSNEMLQIITSDSNNTALADLQLVDIQWSHITIKFFMEWPDGIQHILEVALRDKF